MLNKNVPLIAIMMNSTLRSKDLYVKRALLPDSEIKEEVSQFCPEDKIENNSTCITLSDLEKSVLTLLTSRSIPVMTQQQLCNSLNIKSGSVLNRIQRRLLALGLILNHRIQKGKTFIVVWEATSIAFESLGIKQESHPVIGSNLHAFVVFSVQELYKSKGWLTQVEFKLQDGSLVDLVVRQNEILHCIEVGLPPLEKEVKNANKIMNSELNPNKVIHIVCSGKDKKRLEHLLGTEAEIRNCQTAIEVSLAGDFII